MHCGLHVFPRALGEVVVRSRACEGSPDRHVILLVMCDSAVLVAMIMPWHLMNGRPQAELGRGQAV